MGDSRPRREKLKNITRAHAGETCRPVANRIANRQFPSLPLYDNFNIELSGKELEELKVFWRNYGALNEGIVIKPSLRLILSKLLTWNEGGFYEFTDLGKIPVGALPLRLFNEVQEPLLLEKVSILEERVQRAKLIDSRHLTERVADLRIYSAQLKRILENRLYFLEIKTGRKTLHKIGITKRRIEERVIEVESDLRVHFNQVEI